MKFSIILIILSIILTGCNNNSKYKANEIIETQVQSKNNYLVPYNIYIKNKNYNLSKYEPSSGIYLGSYIQFENNLEVAVEKFEEKFDTKHKVYSHKIKINEDYPLNIILSFYSKGKIPFLTVLPPKDNKDIFNITLIQNLAKELGNLKIPIFINLYENPHLNKYNEQEYIEFFKKAKLYFQTYAENVSLIWSIDQNNVYELKKYYPGDEYIDWVGLNIYETIEKDNKIKKVLTELNYFYNEFQSRKPICISLGISHFSTTTLNYVIQEKIEELKRFYTYIPTKYPRVKLINYINYNNFKINNDKEITHNFSITDNKEILNSYKSLINNDIFLSEINFNNKSSTELEKMNFLCYKYKNNFFIEKENFNNLIYYLKIFDLNKNQFKSNLINNIHYYNINEILEYLKLNLNVNETAKSIII